jgi:diguanylate cyclase (GGDEF)-like protein/PAS domain S-box-containing protein
MKLSDFIRANLDPILDTWAQSAQRIPAARQLNAEALRDHVKSILRDIADDLGHAQTRAEQWESYGKARQPRQKAAARHGATRVMEGFDLNETVSEFRALRTSVLQHWTASDRTATRAILSGELAHFNEAVDQALFESISRYSVEKDRYAHLLDMLLSTSPDLHCLLEVDGKLIYANRALSRLYGMEPTEIIGKNFFKIGTSAVAAVQQQLQLAVKNQATYCGELPYTLASGEAVIYEYLFVPVINEAGKVEAIAGIARDVTERNTAEEKIRHSANYDSLTGLPNRTLFLDRLEREVRHAERSGLPMALLFIDLDGFKQVNDRLGHAAGDQLLLQAAQRISACVRASDTVARLGGDEFTVILTEIRRPLHIEILAQEILEALARPFALIESQAHVSGSVGITLFPQDATTPENLIRNADQAMYAAKHAGRNRFSFFTASMRDSALARLKTIHALRHALSKHRLAVYYQPIVDLSSATVVKAEALLRWRRAGFGLVLPVQFIGLAEEAGLIGDIDAWVLAEAVARAREWSALREAPFQISVNKSPLEFLSKTPILDWDRALAALGLPWNGICVEITEGVLLNDSPGVREKLHHLQDAGIQLAIDDYGTGYSTITYLKKFKVDYLKIDQSFVLDLPTSVDSRIFVETIIGMAHKLGLKVIAEGVESTAQRDCLKEMNCDYAQGFLFSAPIPRRQFAQLLRLQQARQLEQANQSQYQVPD